MANTIHLQALGSVSAIFAEEVRPGMLLSWNYAYQEYECVSCEQVSACFFLLTERSLKDGKEYSRRIKRGRLIAAAWPKNHPNA